MINKIAHKILKTFKTSSAKAEAVSICETENLGHKLKVNSNSP